MADFIDVAGTAEMQSGQMKLVKVEGRDILLARVGDNYYAVENRCPHMGGNLSMGVLNGSVVTCPVHHSQFDLSDGHIIRWTDWTGVRLSLIKIVKSPRPLKTYAVKVENSRILVESTKMPTGVS